MHNKWSLGLVYFKFSIHMGNNCNHPYLTISTERMKHERLSENISLGQEPQDSRMQYTGKLYKLFNNSKILSRATLTLRYLLLYSFIYSHAHLKGPFDLSSNWGSSVNRGWLWFSTIARFSLGCPPQLRLRTIETLEFPPVTVNCCTGPTITWGPPMQGWGMLWANARVSAKENKMDSKLRFFQTSK